MTTFQDLGLSEEVLKAIKELGFEEPSDIQQQAIPSLLNEEADFIGLAQTGTGKTAAFGLPLIERIDPKLKHTQALVLAPTRELGKQIAEQLVKFTKYQKKISLTCVYGGASIMGQMKDLRKPQHIIIATPGRLIDLIKRKAVHLQELEYLVLDEADEMLNMGFKEEIDEILSYTPDDKLTWLFSATMPREIKKIVNTYMDNPNEVRINPKNEVNKNIEHQYVQLRHGEKTSALMRFIDVNPALRSIIFCRTRLGCQDVTEELQRNGYKADSLHGDHSQAQRDRVMKRFKDHKLQLLVATDVAARGIDVNDLTHVFHFNFPDDMAYYTHRSGRTARAGKKGISIAFVGGRELSKLNRLGKKLGIDISKVRVPSNDEVAEIRLNHWTQQILESSGKVSETLLKKVEEDFEELSKEELIAKLVENELSQLKSKLPNESKSRGDDNREDRRGRERSDRSDRRDRSERRDRDGNRKNRRDRDGERGESRRRKDRREDDRRKPKEHRKGKRRDEEIPTSGNPRYFINLGSKDDVNKKDLTEFICAVARVKKSHVSNIDLQGTHSYFEIDAKSEHKVKSRFKDIVLDDGRELRVNKDN